MTKFLMRIVCVAALALLSGCDSPEKSHFISQCVGAGDSTQQCRCTFDALEKDMGEIDGEFVSFAADFAKWGARAGEPGLNREQMMQKYELNDDEYRVLAGEVGGAMLKALNKCQQ